MKIHYRRSVITSRVVLKLSSSFCRCNSISCVCRLFLFLWRHPDQFALRQPFPLRTKFHFFALFTGDGHEPRGASVSENGGGFIRGLSLRSHHERRNQPCQVSPFLVAYWCLLVNWAECKNAFLVEICYILDWTGNAYSFAFSSKKLRWGVTVRVRKVVNSGTPVCLNRVASFLE